MLQAGVDEVGRGCWAGDVFATAVIYPQGFDYPAKDSKSLSSKKRELAYTYLTENVIYSVARASVAEIDTHNILQASLLAMKRAIEALEITPDIVLVDGMHLPDTSYNMRAIISGDSLVPEIAAASIIAKIERDHYMIQECAKLYPAYGFENHKGYGTQQHKDAITSQGICNIHRRSFSPIKHYVCSS